MAVASVPSVGEILLEHVAERLEKYREYVRKAAGGWSLSHAEADEVDELLLELELPAWCLRRDVDATRNMWATTSEHRRVELAWLFPHLFADRRHWAELRRAERGARRRIMAQLREAVPSRA